jgi:sulfoxide reductase catalytic subunit YedY
LVVDAQHFLNALFMIFIIRAGIQILADHARLYWTRHCTPGRDWFRFQKRCRMSHCGRPSRTR